MSLTRRRWMAATGAAAAAAALAPGPLSGASSAPALPPALKPDVFRDRQARLRAAARSGGFDALFVTPSTNLAYSANLSMGRSERLTALLLFSDGPTVLVTPFFEADNHRRDAVVDDVLTWKEDEDPIAMSTKALGKASTVGIEGSTAYATAAKLLSGAAIQGRDATAVFDALRMVKSEEEQSLIREAARRTNLAIEATHKRLSRGMTESEVSNLLEQELQKLGVRGGGLVQFGPSSALPHGGPGDRKLAAGEVVLIDAGCKIHGYTSDVTRTVSFGPPSDELRKVYGVVDRAQIAGIEALRAGVAGEAVDRAARKAIEDGGYGAFFTHRLGHGLGMDGHEPPYLVAGNTTPIAVGNTVTIEPGIYMPGKFGVRIEDDYCARASSLPASLSTRPGDLTIIGS
jgi:Xaa-Pro dipeptidase